MENNMENIERVKKFSEVVNRVKAELRRDVVGTYALC